MGTSYSGNSGQILTLTLWNLWFKTKKVWGSKHWEKRLSSNFYPISESTAEDGTEHRGEFSCTESSAKPNVPSALYLLPSVNPALCLQGDHKNRTRLQAPSVPLGLGFSKHDFPLPNCRAGTQDRHCLCSRAVLLFELVRFG